MLCSFGPIASVQKAVVEGSAWTADSPPWLPRRDSRGEETAAPDPGVDERAAVDAETIEDALAEDPPGSSEASVADATDSTLRAARAAQPAPPVDRRVVARDPTPPPGAAEPAGEAAEDHPQRSSDHSGGQGWIIERH